MPNPDLKYSEPVFIYSNLVCLFIYLFEKIIHVPNYRILSSALLQILYNISTYFPLPFT